MKTLRVGDKNSSVTQLQLLLNKKLKPAFVLLIPGIAFEGMFWMGLFGRRPII